MFNQATAAQSGDEFQPGLDLLRGREVQAVPQHFPPALNGVQVWRLLGVARDHRATRASQCTESSLLSEALLVVLDEMHRFVVLEACPAPHGELVRDQPFVPVPIHVGSPCPVLREDIILKTAIRE